MADGQDMKDFLSGGADGVEEAPVADAPPATPPAEGAPPVQPKQEDGGTPMEPGTSEADPELSKMMEAGADAAQEKANAEAKAAHEEKMKDENNPPPISPKEVEVKTTEEKKEEEKTPVVEPVSKKEVEEENKEKEEESDPDIDKLVDDIMKEIETENSSEPPKVEEENTNEEMSEEDIAKQKNKSKMVIEEIQEELSDTNKQLRQANSDVEWYKNQTEHRKTKAQEALHEAEDSKMKSSSMSNIPANVRELAKQYSSWESADNPSVLDKRNVLLQMAIVYKGITGRDISDVVNADLGVNQTGTQTSSPSSGAPMDGGIQRGKNAAQDQSDYINSIL